jgi:protocatechuate 3,4-dioxygenase beta subunit
MVSRRVWGVLLGAVLALVAFSPPAVAVNPPTQLSATITNPNGVTQAGTVCLERVGSGSCGGTNFTNGTWTDAWVDVLDDPANGQTAGDYLIRVTSSTMDNTTRWYVAGNPAGSSVKADATPVALHSGAPDLHFDMEIPTIATLSGYVKDTFGVGVPNLNVGMVRASGSGKVVKTDANGRYDFGYTQAKTYTLTVHASAEYGGTSGTAIVPASTNYQAPDMTVQLASAIHGQVTGAGGQPLPLIYVEVYTAGTHNYQGSDYTDQLGQYRIPGLGNQNLVARYTDEYGGHERRLYEGGDPNNFAGEVPFVLTSGEDRLVNMALVPKTPDVPLTYNLSGTVRDTDGNPLPGIAVTSADGAGLWDVTDRLGNWYVEAPAGSYRLKFEDDAGKWANYVFSAGHDWAAEYYSGVYQEAEATPVVVAGTQQIGLDAHLSMDAFGGLAPPVVSGSRAVGQVLTVSSGTWTTMPLTQFATTWWRGGTQVGSGPSYLVQAADAGGDLRVRVVATNGTHHATAYSAPAAIERLTSSVAVSGKSPKRGRVRLTIVVSAPGLTPPGTLTVKRGAKVVAGDVAVVDGRAVVKLRRQPSGARRYTVLYGGSAQTLPGTSAVKVRVR